MIQVIIGSTEHVTRDADTRVFDEYTFSLGALREELETPSLFGEHKNIVLLYVLDQFRDELIPFLQSYAGTTPITLREHQLAAQDEKTLTSFGVSIVGAVPPKKESVFNVWSLTDAVLARDKKTAWLLYREAIERGTAPEELSGMVWWQVKSMLLVAREGKPKDMKPYTLSKIQRSLGKYTTKEIEHLTQQVIRAIHEPRKGNGSAEAWMERVLLSL